MTGGQGTFRSLVTSRDFAPGNARGYILYAGNDNNWQFWTGNGAWNVLDGPPVTLNQWTHLVATYDGATAAPVRERRPRRLAGRAATCKTPSARCASPSGNTDGAANYFLPGRVDEVAVYGERAVGGARAGALRGRGLRRRRQPAAERGRAAARRRAGPCL